MLGGIIRNTGLVSFMNYGRVQTLLQVADGLAHEVRAGAGHRIVHHSHFCFRLVITLGRFMMFGQRIARRRTPLSWQKLGCI